MRLATIYRGRVEDVLPTLPAGHFDAVLCDPPYGLRLMGLKWDRGIPPAEVWAEVLRACKPGAPLLAFGGTRTFHRLACAIEDAGWKIRDSVGVAWTHSQGFPKSLDIEKAVTAVELVGRSRPEDLRCLAMGSGYAPSGRGRRNYDHGAGSAMNGSRDAAASTAAGATWDGYGTALKPAWEPVVLAMAPLSGTFAENALEHGAAGLNIGECRIPAGGDRLGGGHISSRSAGWDRPWKEDAAARTAALERGRTATAYAESSGRWPANAIFVHHPECVSEGTKDVRSDSHHPAARGQSSQHLPGHHGQVGLEERAPGVETVERWRCAPGCAVAELERQSGDLQSGFMAAGTQREGIGWGGGLGCQVRNATPGDAGPASRFFYCAKVAPGERGGSKHPTLKPVDLTSYLAKLLLPPARRIPITGPCPCCAEGKPLGDLLCCNGTGLSVTGWTVAPRRILVPFSGAGSEMLGALRVGWEEVVGIEVDPQSVADAERRIREDAPLLNQVEIRGGE